MTASPLRRNANPATGIADYWRRLADVARVRALEEQRLAERAQDPTDAAPHVAQREHLIRLAEDYEKQATGA